MTGDSLRKAISEKKKVGYKSKLVDPRSNGYQRGLLRPQLQYSMQLFRRVSEKAWLLNTIIGHIIDKTIPYMRPLSAKGTRGFALELKEPEAKMNAKDKKLAAKYTEFFLRTAWPDIDNHIELSRYHEDDLIHYTKKILRDVLTLDQVAAEKLRRRNKELLGFEAIDAATIIRCTEEGYQGDDEVRFVQLIDSQVVTTYNKDELIFQFQNPRTDIKHYGYGYSKVEQAVDLVVSLINTFNFNSGAFTEDKLPRGMLLLNGDVGFEEVEEIEDYLIDVMGPDGMSAASGKWGIPIIPSGKSGDKTSIQWQAMGQTNADMQFSDWNEHLITGACSIYGVDAESAGFKLKNASKLIDGGTESAKRYSDDKGIGNALTFLERHFQDIMDDIDDRFKFVFHGFEQDDAKETRETRKSELETFKSMNEIRKENDLPEIKEDWADVPGLHNAQVSQAFQALQGGEEGGEPGGEDEFGDEFSDEELGKSMSDNIVIRI